MSERQNYRDHYARLPDDQLQSLALRKHQLLPQASAALEEELEKRNLTNLEAFRQTAEENSATARDADAITSARFSDWMRVATIVALAWTGAVALPFIVPLDRAPRAEEVGMMSLFLGFVAVSGYLGIRARRQGRTLAFVLRAVVPLVLLALSTIAMIVL